MFWLECVNDDIKRMGLRKEMALDRTEWRSAIKIHARPGIACLLIIYLS